MPPSSLLRLLLALSDEGATALATDPPWPGYQHSAIRASDSYSAFAEAAASESSEMGRLMAGATLNVAHEIGGYSTTTPDGAWVIARLLDDGTRLAAAEGRTDREAVHRGLSRALDGLLDALASGRCRTRGYLGLRGISLEGTEAADVGVGVLRRLNAEEFRSLKAQTDSWPVREDELCLALESEAAWSVSDAPPQPARSGTQDAMSRSELAPALLLLSGVRNKGGNLRAPHVVWSRPSPYFFLGGGSGGGLTPDLHWRTESIYDGIVTPAVAEAARLLLPSLSGTPPAFAVAVRRLVSACLVYNKPAEERLVDAAIAWEALLGSQDRDQLSLQLALGIAWLLAADNHADRERTFRRAKKIYALRSKLVHGGGARADEVEEAANQLTDWLRHALIALVTTHSPLMHAGNRAQRLLLQDPGNLAQDEVQA